MRDVEKSKSSSGGKSVSTLDSHLGFWLRYVSNYVSGRFEKSVEGAGVSISEWVALRTLYSKTESTPADLMQELGMTKGAISKILGSLEKKELLKRETSLIDRRAQHISLTRKGKNLVPELAALADENDELFFGHMSPQQRMDLMSGMQKIIDLHGMRKIPVE
ncbi:MarR family winged helix-turn-helix transcriptional regulator [Undibacterium sp. Di27W]